MTDQFILPEYPALYKCILVDARHASRTVLVKDIHATALFEIISEGGSLQEGMMMLEQQATDACFIGPSISPKKAAEFLKKGKERMFSKDCALVAIINKEEDSEAAQKLLLESGAHVIVKRPCSKLALADGIVRAIVLANSGSAWASIFFASGHNNAVVDAASVVTAQPLERPDVAETPNMSAELENIMFAAIASASLANLKDIAVGVESGVFRLDPQGRPTPATHAEVVKTCQQLLPSADDELDDKTVEFRQFFERCLLQWVVDLVNGDEPTATEKLRLTLLSYTPSGS